MDPSLFQQQPGEGAGDGEEGRPLMSPVDLATELVSGTDTCEELGLQAFLFFEASLRVLC